MKKLSINKGLFVLLMIIFILTYTVSGLASNGGPIDSDGEIDVKLSAQERAVLHVENETPMGQLQFWASDVYLVSTDMKINANVSVDVKMDSTGFDDYGWGYDLNDVIQYRLLESDYDDYDDYEESFMAEEETTWDNFLDEPGSKELKFVVWQEFWLGIGPAEPATDEVTITVTN